MLIDRIKKFSPIDYFDVSVKIALIEQCLFEMAEAKFFFNMNHRGNC